MNPAAQQLGRLGGLAKSAAKYGAWQTGQPVTEDEDRLCLAFEDRQPCPHSATDGTVPCKGCGLSALAFITDARQWLDNHDGETRENPGYTLEP